MQLSRRSVHAALAAAALGIPLAGAPAAPAQDPSGPCDVQQPQPGECAKSQVATAVETVRGVCFVREGKYCVVTLGDILDQTLPPAVD